MRVSVIETKLWFIIKVPGRITQTSHQHGSKTSMKITWLKINKVSQLLILSAIINACQADTSNPLLYEDNEVYVRLVLRSTEQLTGFYTGREFPEKAISEILKTCFITPIVKNRTLEALWIEPNTWVFSRKNKPIERIKRNYWKKIWQDNGLSLAHQSTFGWTLMPETRDLRFDEGVGGSIVIPIQTEPFTLQAHFSTGLKKEGKPRLITFKNISCAK